MDQRSREQIRLILDDVTDRACKAAVERLQAVYTDRNRRGLLHSSVTVGGAIESLEEDGTRYVVDCVDRVAAIDMSVEAFAMLSEANERFLTFLSAKFDEAARKGLGGRGQQSRAPNFDDQFAKLWREASERSRRQLELHRFSFTVPSSDSLDKPMIAQSEHPAPPLRNVGGKPVAKHWDAMWAHIAIRLYTLDLEPESQADIERAMFDWLVAQNISAGETAVRQRARQLWSAYQKVVR